MEKITVKSLKENKGMAALLGALLVACAVMLWINFKPAPPLKAVTPQQAAPNEPEAQKMYEQQAEQAKKSRSPSGS